MRDTIELLFKLCTTFVLLGLILILIGALPAALGLAQILVFGLGMAIGGFILGIVGLILDTWA
jgi:uncharacterized membrane protein YiaA